MRRRQGREIGRDRDKETPGERERERDRGRERGRRGRGREKGKECRRIKKRKEMRGIVLSGSRTMKKGGKVNRTDWQTGRGRTDSDEMEKCTLKPGAGQRGLQRRPTLALALRGLAGLALCQRKAGGQTEGGWVAGWVSGGRGAATVLGMI